MTWPQAVTERVWWEGFVPNTDVLWDGFVYAVGTGTSQTFRYASITPGGPRALIRAGDDEINGIMGLRGDFTPNPDPVPEPGTLALAGSALLGAPFGRRRFGGNLTEGKRCQVHPGRIRSASRLGAQWAPSFLYQRTRHTCRGQINARSTPRNRPARATRPTSGRSAAHLPGSVLAGSRHCWPWPDLRRCSSRACNWLDNRSSRSVR